MTKNNKAPAATRACQCTEHCVDCQCNSTSKKQNLPTINPLIIIALERFAGQVRSAEFHSREFNESAPQLIEELLRIIRGVRHDR